MRIDTSFSLSWMTITRIVSTVALLVVYSVWWWFSDKTIPAILAGIGVALVAWFLSIGAVVWVKAAMLSKQAKG